MMAGRMPKHAFHAQWRMQRKSYAYTKRRGKRDEMIYTIGHRESYLRGLEAGQLYKTGRHDSYPGGYAFKTREDAQRRIDEAYDESYAVFGLDADWEQDTVPSKHGWWHALVVDRPIILLQDMQ